MDDVTEWIVALFHSYGCNEKEKGFLSYEHYLNGILVHLSFVPLFEIFD